MSQRVLSSGLEKGLLARRIQRPGGSDGWHIPLTQSRVPNSGGQSVRFRDDSTLDCKAVLVWRWSKLSARVAFYLQ